MPPLHPFAHMDLATALDERAAKLADKVFLIWEPRAPGVARSWTYASFADDVARVARGLRARGVCEGDAVMVLLENSPAFLLCFFACARIGAVAINTNTRYSADELRHAVAVTRPVGVITHEHRLDGLETAREHFNWVATISEATGSPEELFVESGSLPARVPDPGAPVCVQFTSGSTSRPKAALITHANALWGGQVGCSNQGLRDDDIAMIFAPLFHTGAFSWQMLSHFWAGATVVLMPKFSGSRFWEASCKHRCTTLFTVGLMLQVLAQQEVPEHDYRLWICGAEVPDIEERYGVRTFSGWGMTETVSQVIINHPVLRSAPATIGRVAPGYSVRIVGEDGEDVAPGQLGDLLVRGVRGLSLFAEYFGDPDATAASFDDDGYFITGDRVGLLDDGTIRFVSRIKDMLKVGGESVAAAEIERVLLEIPGIAAAAAVSRPDPLLGEVPVAFITLGPDAVEAVVRVEATARCVRELADFKVPRSIHVVDELPTAAVGKIAKGKLRDLAVVLHDEEVIRSDAPL